MTTVHVKSVNQDTVFRYSKLQVKKDQLFMTTIHVKSVNQDTVFRYSKLQVKKKSVIHWGSSGVLMFYWFY